MCVNTAERRQSASGGVCSALARSVVERGGIVFGVEHSRLSFPAYTRCETIEELEKTRGSAYLQANPGTPLRICWAGEHIPRKALDLLLHALPLCKEKVELHVLSKGPRMETWKKLSHKLGLDGVVTFHGFVPREEAFQIMSTNHVFCITSVREDTTTVVFEAFRYGLPIIATDHCGFATVINETCGIKIPIYSRAQVIGDYARHLDWLATHEEERRRLSQGALERCRNFTWDAKMKVLNGLYAEAAGK